MMKITAISDHQCQLGEGPLWDPRDQRLYWVDSLGPVIYWLDFRSNQVDRFPLPGKTIGSLAVREQGGLVLAMDHGFYEFDVESERVSLIAEPLVGRDGIRFNDGKVDPFGHFVSGAMNLNFTEGKENCPMFRLTPDHEVIEILDGFQCFNGPCFSENGEQIYLTGRGDLTRIEVFDYGVTQVPRNSRVLHKGNPDGATVDADGYLWSAQWDEACIVRISPQGEVDARIDIPGQLVSSVMFGGSELDLIFVTTVGHEELGSSATDKLPGRTLVIKSSGFQGRPEPMFQG